MPYVDSEGHPYLPAFRSVPFRIQVTVPDEPGRQKVLFTIDGPKQMPGFYGIVDVIPAADPPSRDRVVRLTTTPSGT